MISSNDVTYVILSALWRQIFREVIAEMKASEVITEENLKDYLKITSTIKGCPIYFPVYRKIRDLIICGYYKKGDKMPAEAELSAMFGVGRTTLRTALAILHEDGYLHTSQGKGTFIVYEPESEIARYPDRALPPRKRLEMRSKEICISNAKVSSIDYDEFLDEKLGAEGKPIDVFSRVLSNGKADCAIICTTFYIKGELGDLHENDPESMESQLEQIFESRVNYVTCTFSPLSDIASTDLPIPATSDSFILVSSTWIGYDNKPVAYCKDYYNAEAFRFRAKFMK